MMLLGSRAGLVLLYDESVVEYVAVSDSVRDAGRGKTSSGSPVECAVPAWVDSPSQLRQVRASF